MLTTTTEPVRHEFGHDLVNNGQIVGHLRGVVTLVSSAVDDGADREMGRVRRSQNFHRDAHESLKDRMKRAFCGWLPGSNRSEEPAISTVAR